MHLNRNDIQKEVNCKNVSRMQHLTNQLHLKLLCFIHYIKNEQVFIPFLNLHPSVYGKVFFLRLSCDAVLCTDCFTISAQSTSS